MSHTTVAAVIPTKNVVNVIRPTLESLRFCDEVIIVDMFSHDGTRELCESYPNVRFFQRDDYIYGNFNFGLEQARSEWIIRLDSDEVISKELQDSIIEVLKSPTRDGPSAYEAICHLYFFGKRLRHGFGDQFRTTLFKKGCASYQVRSEHEHLEITGSSGRLTGHYEHFTNPTVSTWIQKTNYYTDKDVERLADPRTISAWRVTYTVLRQFQRLYFGPGWLMRDGYLGFVVAGVAAFSRFIEAAKIWEKAEARHDTPSQAINDAGTSAN